MQIEAYLTKQLKRVLEDFEIDQADMPDIQLETPRDPEHGDVATNVAMQLAKPLRNNPRKIAAEIVEKLELDPKLIESAGVAGPGFINFRYSDQYLTNALEELISQGEGFGRSDEKEGQKALVEFVSANPTGPLTVGHGRNAVLGDTVARLLEWTGADVEREYYFNNAGRQMRKLGLSVKARYLQAIGKDAEMPEDGYEGEYIKEIAQLLIDEHGEKLADEKDETVLRKPQNRPFLTRYRRL